MEALRKKIYLTAVIILLSSLCFSQDYKKIQDAFSGSYKLETSGSYTKAIDMLKTVYDEKSYEINLRLGWLNYMAGLFTESISYYQKAISLMPYSIEAKLGIVNPAAAAGNWEQVKTEYNEILKIDPQNTTANYRLGVIYYGKQDYNTAYKYFEKVVNLYPFGYDALIMFAWCNYKLGKLREAKVLFNKVLMYSPTDSSALEGLGLIK
jgi:tetratricopeptide (TPR) repeat protein